MAWTAPRTWVTSEVITAAQLNAHIRDNLNFVHETHGPIWIPAIDIFDDGTNNLTPNVLNYNSNETATIVASYNDAVLRRGWFSRYVPADWISGGFVVKVVWTALGASGNVRWVFSYKFIGENESYVGAPTTVSGDYAAPTVPLRETDTLTTTSAPTAGDLMRFELQRAGAHANDTLGSSALVAGLLLEYT